MQHPKYSLLVPVRNEVARIESVVRSIFTDLTEHEVNTLNQVQPAIRVWEICLGDDFSDDGTFERLEILSAELPFRLIRPIQNIGRGAIRNLLAQEARAPMLFFMDGDCCVQPGYFKAWDNTNPNFAHLGRVNYNSVPKSGFSRFLARGSGISKSRNKNKIPPAYFTSANFCISKSNFLKVQGFRTDLLGWGGEDGDLGYQLQNVGVDLAYNEKAAILHPSITRLEEYFARLKQFGEFNLPVLISENKELGIQFKLQFSKNPWAWVCCNAIIYWICYTLVTKMVSWPWPFIVYRYVIFYSYSSGYKARKISIQN